MSGRDGYNFVQISRSIREDPDFGTVWADDNHLAAWLRLFLEADDVWPEPASLPRRAAQESIDHLAEIGVIELRPGDMYRMAEVDNARRARSVAAAAAGRARQDEADRDPTNGRYRKATPAPDQRPLDVLPAPAGSATNARWTDGAGSPAQTESESESESETEGTTSPRAPLYSGGPVAAAAAPSAAGRSARPDDGSMRRNGR